MTNSWHLYLTGSQARLRRVSGWRRHRVADISEWAWDSRDPRSLTLAPLDVPAPYQPLNVYLGSALTRWALVAFPLSDPAERRIATQAYLEAHYGIAPDEWACTLDQSRHDGPTLVCAIRRDLLERLRELAPVRQLRLLSVAPYMQAVWNHFIRKTRSPATLITLEPDAMTVLVTGVDRLELVRSFGHQGQPDLIERELKRLRLSAPTDALSNVHLGFPALLRAMASGTAAMLTPATRSVYLGRERYGDFRDLGFCEQEPQ